MCCGHVYIFLSVTSQYCTKWLNVGSCKQCYTIAEGLWISDAKDLGEMQSPCILEMMQHRDIVVSDIAVFVLERDVKLQLTNIET